MPAKPKKKLEAPQLIFLAMIFQKRTGDIHNHSFKDEKRRLILTKCPERDQKAKWYFLFTIAIINRLEDF